MRTTGHSREQRLEVGDALKRGALRAIVATSSLELGIDMGAVDLVIQVETPGSVASGLQRIGRDGHQVGEPSHGTILQKYRGDSLEAAVVPERMLAGLIEETRVPQNPLNVLAQQIVAMSAVDQWQVADLRATVRRAANFTDLSDEIFTAVLDLLAGTLPLGRVRRAPAADRLGPRGRHDPRARRRGPHRDHERRHDPRPWTVRRVPADGARVGKLDEEMVYKTRPGEVFVLGASSWRVEDITRDRVIVSPAPGEPGKMPFWHGDKPGRPIELGRALGAVTREVAGAARSDALARLRGGGLDELAAENLVAYLEDQRAATGALPDDRTVVIERFPDELGDWRVCILSPFGAIGIIVVHLIPY